MLSKVRQWRVVRLAVRRVGVHRVTAVAGLVQAPLLAILALVLRRLPRNDRLVVMGSPLDRFADNAAYLYVYLSEHVPDRQVVWVSGSIDVVRRLRSHGYRAETRWSRGGIMAALRAGTFVYSGYCSDINRWLWPGATTVSLWHGLPIKRVEGAIGRDDRKVGGLLHRLAQAARERPPDFLLAPSEFVTRCFSPAFGVPPERCWQLGYPRNDHLLADPAKPPAALVWHEREWARLSSARPVVGLFLTWRDGRVNDTDSELVQQLAEVCSAHGGVLAYKAHYNVAAAEVRSPMCVTIPADADLHAYLGLCDVLVTDYSSIALDFLLIRRPVVYFMPDLEHYAATRGFEVDPLELPGVVTRDRETLMASLDRILADPGALPWQPLYDRFLQQMWGSYTGHASETLAVALAAPEAVGAPGAGMVSRGAANPAH
ncbi:CDP-glycerol glycerophosphotransferase family protein [Micromonospora sp. IBHARD004]|uniref:CDP-glycerol glycerophosphotransferase family protein n=1 Tax=Micromonospora sp. IBHARD004 TaxID=3457764 RepID=UPI004058B506